MEREKKLQVRDLTISFRTVNGKLQAVRDISFDLYKGETLAIVGESGSGKSATSKTILGISAANTIIEGGEILYDGKDLLKITEEDFHAIRGDKIAMVFQDPLSSLNPIMRVGKQLTEAMLLKNKANRRDSRRKLSVYMKHLDEIMSQSSSMDKGEFATFRRIIHTEAQYEGPYDRAYSGAEAALKSADDILLEIEKEQLDSIAEDVREFRNYCFTAINPYVIRDGESLKNQCRGLNGLGRKALKKKETEELKKRVAYIREMLETALKAEAPDFFALGCYIVLEGGKPGDADGAELNRMTAGALNGSFMEEFRRDVTDALRFSAAGTNSRMTESLVVIESLIHDFGDRMPENYKAARKKIEYVASTVEAAIDPLDTIKSSAAYTFKVGIESAVRSYYEAIEKNAREQKRFDRQTARYERKLRSGRRVNGKVAPLALVDIDNAYGNIMRILQNMTDQFREKTAGYANIDYENRYKQVTEWLVKTAKAEVHRITKSMAKDSAIRIMEQVGISEARKRYRQYPFEFSGGMRQRIVIAISLTADPDILICDEPTTALDVTIQAQILDLINDLKKQRNLSVIFITHDLGVVAHMADRIAVMYAGKIVEYGTAYEVFHEPAHPYTWALLSSIPDLDSKEKLESIPGTPPNMIYPPKGDAFAARNKYAMDIDFEEQPPMFRITDTHYAATWLLHPDAPHLELPEIVKNRIARMEKEEGAVNG